MYAIVCFYCLLPLSETIVTMNSYTNPWNGNPGPDPGEDPGRAQITAVRLPSSRNDRQTHGEGRTKQEDVVQ